MNKKPLDLSKPVQTRDGRPARILATDVDHPEYPIVALVRLLGIGREAVRSFTAAGYYTCLDQSGTSPDDLVNVPERNTKTFWVNMYPYDAPVAHLSADTAIEERSARGTTVKVTVEYVEGEDQL